MVSIHKHIDKSILSRWAIFLLLALICCLPRPLYSEESQANANRTDIQKAREIKLKRIAVTWYQQPMDIALHTGEVESGRLMIFEDGEFRLKTANGVRNVPAHNVKSVTLKKQSQDLLLVGLTGLGGAGLFSAAVSLSTNADQGKVTVAALIGAVAGSALGWKFFYQDIVIQIE